MPRAYVPVPGKDELKKANDTYKAHLALLTVNLFYGGNYIIAKGVMPHYLGPYAFILLRVLFTLLLFTVFSAFSKERVEKKDMPRLALAGLFGVALNQLLFFKGLSLTSPINSSIIITSNPILVLVLSYFLLKSPVTRTKLAGICLGATGAVLLILTGNREGLGTGNPWGDVLIFLNATSFAVFLVISKPLMSKYQPVTVMKWAFMFGLMVVIPVSLEDLLSTDLSSFTLPVYASVAYVLVCATFLVYFLNMYALQRVAPSVASSYIYLQPVFAVAFAYAASFLSDQVDYTRDLTLEKGAYALLVFAGVYLTGRSSAK